MGMSAVQYKLMPESPETNLEKIKEVAKSKIKEKDGIFSNAEEVPIAFGLKSLTISFAFPEEKEIDELGNELEKIEGVSSIELIDYRRALG
ncbi:MAG: elongation factor 1-beta/delta [archaeon]